MPRWLCQVPSVPGLRGASLGSTESAQTPLILWLQLPCPAAALWDLTWYLPQWLLHHAKHFTQLTWKISPKHFFFYLLIVFIWTISSVFSPSHWISCLCSPLLFMLLFPWHCFPAFSTPSCSYSCVSVFMLCWFHCLFLCLLAFIALSTVLVVASLTYVWWDTAIHYFTENFPQRIIPPGWNDCFLCFRLTAVGRKYFMLHYYH